MADKRHLRLADPEPKPDLFRIAAASSVRLVVARAAIRQIRTQLLLLARVSGHQAYDASGEDPLHTAISLAFREAYRRSARLLRGLDR